MTNTYCGKCGRTSEVVHMKQCPFCHQESQETFEERTARQCNEFLLRPAPSPQEPASWEKIFDERYIDKGTPSGLNQRAFKNHKHMVDDIKSFIQSLLLSQKSKLLESMGKMKGRFGDSSSYNFALEDVEELIKGL